MIQWQRSASMDLVNDCPQLMPFFRDCTRLSPRFSRRTAEFTVFLPNWEARDPIGWRELVGMTRNEREENMLRVYGGNYIKGVAVCACKGLSGISQHFQYTCIPSKADMALL